MESETEKFDKLRTKTRDVLAKQELFNDKAVSVILRRGTLTRIPNMTNEMVDEIKDVFKIKTVGELPLWPI